MTNGKDLDRGDEPALLQPEESRLLLKTGTDLVKDIFDEAYIIANTAQSTGQPWRYIKMLKSLRDDSLIANKDGHEADDEYDEDTYIISKGNEVDTESDVTEISGRDESSNIVTSTPTKDDESYLIPATSCLGQGDGELDSQVEDIDRRVSMLTPQLLHLGEVDEVIVYDNVETEISQHPADNTCEAMDGYVNDAFNMVFSQEYFFENKDSVVEVIQSYERYLSLRSDDLVGDDDTQSISYDVISKLEQKELKELDDAEIETEKILHIAEVHENVQLDDLVIDVKTDKDQITKYEDAFLTLNRDFEQCSDDEDNAVTQDTKETIFQEVELIAPNSTYDGDSLKLKDSQMEEINKLAAIPQKAEFSGTKSKSNSKSIVSRWKSHGARFLTFIRGWWRRRSPSQCKDSKHRGSMRSVYPMSPVVRRRATSLLDNRCHSTPGRTKKFNTINEAMVNSSKWKEYTFEEKPEECGEI